MVASYVRKRERIFLRWLENVERLLNASRLVGCPPAAPEIVGTAVRANKQKLAAKARTILDASLAATSQNEDAKRLLGREPVCQLAAAPALRPLDLPLDAGAFEHCRTSLFQR
jgi:hypothetical protein